MRKSLFFVLVAAGLLFAACGSGGSEEADASNEVASLDDAEGGSLADAADAAELPDEPTLTPEDAALAFSQCMRDEGIDFPDAGVDAEGNVNLRESFQSVERSDELQAARAACQENLEAGGFGGGQDRAGNNDQIQDALVAYTDCIRDQGFDVGDITLGGQGQGQGQDGNQAQNQDQNNQDGAQRQGQQGQQGQRQGGFGGPQGRIVAQLGLDAEDPEVQAALEACNPELEEAFADFGGGGGGGGGRARG